MKNNTSGSGKKPLAIGIAAAAAASLALVLALLLFSKPNPSPVSKPKPSPAPVKAAESITSLEQGIDSWTDVWDIEVGSGILVALRSDGTVRVAVDGKNSISDAENWENIVRISLGNSHLVGLDGNGRVHVATVDGKDSHGIADTGHWPAVSRVIATPGGCLGIDDGGRHYYSGDPEMYPFTNFILNYAHLFTNTPAAQCKDLSFLGDYSSVIASMSDEQFKKNFGGDYSNPEELVRYLNSWNYLQSVRSYAHAIIALDDMSNYTIWSYEPYNRLDTREYLLAADIGLEGRVILLTSNLGVLLGDPMPGMESSAATDNIKMSNVMAVDSGREHLLGLSPEHEVKADGDNSRGQCNVSGWRNVRSIAAGDYASFAVTEDGRILATGEMQWGSGTIKLG